MRIQIRPLLFALALIAVACGLRWPGLGRTVWNLDEGSTFTMAEVVRNGGVLYHDAADNRTPLVPYAKALIFSVVGDWNIRGAHIALALMVGLTAVWLWRLARAAGDEAAGIAGAVGFTLVSFIMLDPVDAMAAHTGWFLIFFSALGMWAFLGALTRESDKLALLAGTLFALAALAKQPGLLDWGVCLVLCGLIAWTTPERRRLCTRLAAMLSFGLAWPMIATFAYFAAHGAWNDFLQYAWYYNIRLYVPAVPLHERLLGVCSPFRLAWENAPFALGLGLVGTVWLLAHAVPSVGRRSKAFPVLPWLILGWAASGLVSTVLSGRNFDHYSIQVLPGLSLACGWVAVRIWKSTAGWHQGSLRLGGWLLRIALGVGLLSLSWAAVRRMRSFDDKEIISQEIGLAVKARTSPDEKIFVWGYEPELHVFSQRLPNTRFIYSVFLTGLIPWTNLDPQKNTDYAIVPGAWDAFWQDFTLRPPAMIVDTRANRGFLKYPLNRQARLWKIVEKDYAEVAGDYANARGYALYQRVTAAPDSNLSSLPVNEQLSLAVPSRSHPGTIKARVDAPAGSAAIDLYLDGRPYRHIENPGEPAVQIGFFLQESDLAPGRHTLQAVARGAQDTISAIRTLTVEAMPPADRRFAGPVLTFAGHEFTPIESEVFGGQALAQEGGGQWNAHAPSRLAFFRPEGLIHVDFTFGLNPGAYDGSNPQKSDGVDIVVYFEDDDGRQTRVYRRNLDPVNNAADRVLQSGRAALPGRVGGKIIFLITPGPMNNPAYDWAYWRAFSGDTPDGAISFRGQPVPVIAEDGKSDLVSPDFLKHDGRQFPSHFSFRLVPGMADFSGDFGLPDDSWQGLPPSSGAIFEIEQVLPNGTRQMLFSRTLSPLAKEDDRGVQSFHILLAYTEGAQIRLTTRATHPADSALHGGFWYGLILREFSARLTFEGREIDSVSSEAVNGLSYLDENGATVLFAHAPSQITFPLEAGARRLEGEIGLLQRAYTGDGPTDGVVFVVEVEAKDKTRRELFRRHLNPRDVPAERGSIPFSVDLPALSDGRLILHTLSAPSGKLNCAWSYWSKLQLIR